MNWVIKASLQKSLSYLPMGSKANYLLQRHITKGLPVNDETFIQKVLDAIRHFNSYLEYCQPENLSSAVFYEFGAGWDLITPLVYYALGIEHQTVVDIHPNIHFELVHDALRRLTLHKLRLEQIAGRSFRAIDSSPLHAVEELAERFGIRYLAPCDARNTKLPAESYDFVSNTSTLEHIPESDILKILVECYRLLKPRGVASSIIDMQDHYSYFDASISCYNFLKYSDAFWKAIDSPLHFQNRLRFPDYMKLFEQSGLAIIAHYLTKPTSGELEALRALSLSPSFRGKYTLADLGVKDAQVVARKGGTI